MIDRSKFASAYAVMMLVVAVVACNLSNRLKPKRAPAKPCFGTDQTASSQPRYLLAPDGAGSKVMLPAGFTTVIPPEALKPGYEYTGTSYYSYNFPCHCRLNFTEITATGLPYGDDEAALLSRRDLVTIDQSPPATLDKEERKKVQDHPAISLYTTGKSVEKKTEYNRYEFIVARGRIYEIHFASETKAELDHPEVDAYFKSFELTDELDSQVISKPEPEKSRLPLQQGKGTVVVEVTVSADGRVKEATAISGPIFLRPSAQQAAMKARFAPDKAERKGILTYEFK